jgi:nitrogen-specific signal transduction histidine kinase
MTASSLRISSSHSEENQRQLNRPPPESESRIVSSLAHEINNPVEALHHLHYLIETEGTLKEKGRQYLALAREEVRRISQILRAAMEHASREIEIVGINGPSRIAAFRAGLL